MIQKKITPLTIAIADHTKLNRFYSHKSIQKYIRYLFTSTCPNPMWLSIKRQSQILHIYYFDIEIEDYLFEHMLEGLEFLGEKITHENKGVFREQRMNRSVWESLLVYDEEEKFAREEMCYMEEVEDGGKKMAEKVYDKYLASVLTRQEMRDNLYPDLELPLYQKYHSISGEPVSQ